MLVGIKKPLRMRHQSENPATRVLQPCNRLLRTIGILPCIRQRSAPVRRITRRLARRRHQPSLRMRNRKLNVHIRRQFA